MKHISKVRKRNGKIVNFNKVKIAEAIYKAIFTVKGKDGKESKKFADKVIKIVADRFSDKVPSVENVQDIVEEVLIHADLPDVARAYILYREKRREAREIIDESDKSVDMVDKYLTEADWEIKENANMTYSLQGLNNYIAGIASKKYWLNRIYPQKIRETIKAGSFHIHDLSSLSTYCMGWDLHGLLVKGFTGVFGKISSKPAKHFRSALGHVVNFFYTLQGEAAGAEAFSSFDTYLAPFIAYDKLNYKQVKQAIQEFLFNCNVPTRVGFQCPFTNITLDLKVPKNMAKLPVVIGGKVQDRTYGEFQKEMDMLNKAFYEVVMEGDSDQRVFTFPIPTINITKDFNWDNPAYKPMWEATAKYGINYFSNFINSDLDPEDIRSMCCRLRLNNKELHHRGGGLFGSAPLTGSVGVVTINLPQIGYLNKTKKEFFERLRNLMDLAKESLEIKRKVLEDFMEKGLYPYSKFYLSEIKKLRKSYLANHFSTIGLIGLNEALLNFMGKDIVSKEGRKFALQVLDFMSDCLLEYQKKTGHIYNLEATPAEGSLGPEEKILINRNYPEMIAIGALIDNYLEKNKNKIKIIGNSEILKLSRKEMFAYGFSRKTQKFKKYPVTGLVRHQGHSMYEVITCSGRKVKITGEHSLFALSKQGVIKEVKVSGLEKEDYVAVPKKINIKSVYKEINLIELFKDSSFKNNFYLVCPSEYIEKLIKMSKIADWGAQNYKSKWKDVKCMWRKNKVIPLKLIYDLDVKVARKTASQLKIFYRKSKNTKPIKVLISLNKNFGFMVGSLLSEGWLALRSEFTNTNEDFIREFFSACENIFGKGSVELYSQSREKTKRKTIHKVILSQITGYFFKEIGLEGKSDKKIIPGFLFSSSKDTIIGLLKGFHLGDGYYYNNKQNCDYAVNLFSNSQELIEGLNLCLLRLGILTKFRGDEKSKYNSKWKDNYILSITGADNLNKYFQLIFHEKLEINNTHSSREMIPVAPSLIKEIMKKNSLKPSDIDISKDSFNRNIRENKISYQYLKKIISKLKELLDKKEIEHLIRLIDSDIYWDKIKEIKKLIVPKYVYDLEIDVKGDLVENFLGGQGLICLHNTSYRLAKMDKRKYPDIITAGASAPYYTNSSQLHVDYQGGLLEALRLQDEFQTKYTGGTVFHAFLGEKISDAMVVKNLIKKVFTKFHLPYFTLTPTFSICPNHGYLSGEHFVCPQCHARSEVYSRIVGYLRPVQQWNKGKQEEYGERKHFEPSL